MTETTSAPDQSFEDSSHLPDRSRPAAPPEDRLRHDVRQAVSAIMLLAASLERGSLRVPIVAERIDLMHRELDWVAETVQAEEQPVSSPTDVDAGTVVDQVFSSLMEGSPCSMTLTREAGLRVYVDPVELHRSMHNLLDNATRAAGIGGHVEVRARSSSSEVVVEVEDDGPGFGRIPTHHGLGLSTVGRFVRHARAALAIEQSSSGGSLVSLRMPRLRHQAGERIA